MEVHDALPDQPITFAIAIFSFRTGAGASVPTIALLGFRALGAVLRCRESASHDSCNSAFSPIIRLITVVAGPHLGTLSALPRFAIVMPAVSGLMTWAVMPASPASSRASSTQRLDDYPATHDVLPAEGRR